jgi:hypothetical protein
MANQILELEHAAMHSVKRPKANPKVQTHTILFPIQNNTSNLTAKILSFYLFMNEWKKKLTALGP